MCFKCVFSKLQCKSNGLYRKKKENHAFSGIYPNLFFQLQKHFEVSTPFGIYLIKSESKTALLKIIEWSKEDEECVAWTVITVSVTDTVANRGTFSLVGAASVCVRVCVCVTGKCPVWYLITFTPEAYWKHYFAQIHFPAINALIINNPIMSVKSDIHTIHSGQKQTQMI